MKKSILKLLLIGCLFFYSCNKEIQNNASSYFSISPNPGPDFFCTTLANNKWAVGIPFELKVTDGKDIVKFQANSNIGTISRLCFSLNNQPDGYYYANLTINGNTYTQPFIKTGG
ncbi:MAG: hypothetical protein IPM42_05245 [Saprospiraceae bacterium]|nr:hypothetical protein [Saprospiraceae bacterium]